MAGEEHLELTMGDAEALPLDARTLLVVDDSRTNLHVLGRRLPRMGFRTILADSGTMALDLLQSRPFDLVLLDMVMPGLSGIRTLGEMRRNQRTAEVPVLMLTARSDPGAVVEALDAGADDHVAKPFDFEVLRARIERLLARARAVSDLRRANVSLDARIATRAMEMGELRQKLAETTAESIRLASSIRFLEAEVRRLNGGTSGAA